MGGWLDTLVAERNAAREAQVAKERAVLRALPVRPLAVSRELQATVSRSSTIRVVGKTHSVPSKLRGEVVRVHLYATELEVEYAGEVIVRLPRLSGHGAHRIDYHHVVHSLVRKPGAFRRYAYRDALFPSVVFRQAYDALLERGDTWADLEYMRILHLAATTMETSVAEALELIHPLILLSNDTKDFLEYPLLHKHLQKPLHQWTDSLIRPVGNMVIQHQPLTKQRVRSIFHRVRL